MGASLQTVGTMACRGGLDHWPNEKLLVADENCRSVRPYLEGAQAEQVGRDAIGGSEGFPPADGDALIEGLDFFDKVDDTIAILQGV